MAHKRNRTAYDTAIGTRLRSIRNAKGLSLHDVERQSHGKWKAVVVGSYERGDRSASVARLCELVDWYGEDITSVLPSPKPRQDGTPDYGPDVDIACRDGRWCLIIHGPDLHGTASSSDRGVLDALAETYVRVRRAQGPGKAA